MYLIYTSDNTVLSAIVGFWTIWTSYIMVLPHKIISSRDVVVISLCISVVYSVWVIRNLHCDVLLVLLTHVYIWMCMWIFVYIDTENIWRNCSLVTYCWEGIFSISLNSSRENFPINWQVCTERLIFHSYGNSQWEFICWAAKAMSSYYQFNKRTG